MRLLREGGFSWGFAQGALAFLGFGFGSSKHVLGCLYLPLPPLSSSGSASPACREAAALLSSAGGLPGFVGTVSAWTQKSGGWDLAKGCVNPVGCIPVGGKSNNTFNFPFSRSFYSA